MMIDGRFGRMFPSRLKRPVPGWLPDDSDAGFEVGWRKKRQWRSVTDDPDGSFVHAYRKIPNSFLFINTEEWERCVRIVRDILIGQVGMGRPDRPAHWMA